MPQNVNSENEDSAIPFRQKLSAPQVIALNSILQGETYRNAAAKAGVDERTLRRWRYDDSCFEAALRQSIQERRSEVCERAMVASATALESVVRIAGDSENPHCLRAAAYILQLAGIGPQKKARITQEEVQFDQFAAYR